MTIQNDQCLIDGLYWMRQLRRKAACPAPPFILTGRAGTEPRKSGRRYRTGTPTTSVPPCSTQLVPEPRIEALTVAVLPWRAAPDEQVNQSFEDVE